MTFSVFQQFEYGGNRNLDWWYANFLFVAPELTQNGGKKDNNLILLHAGEFKGV